MYFQHPLWLVAGIVVIIWYITRFWKTSFSDNKHPFFHLIAKKNNFSGYHTIRHIIVMLVIFLFSLILSRVYLDKASNDLTYAGIDIVLVLDLSKSMLADDFTPNRLEVAKEVIQEFVRDRVADRVGLVVFAGKPFTSFPLSLDYSFIQGFISGVSTDTINQEIRSLQGTATGEGLLAALGMLEDGRAEGESNATREQIIVLLTDGEVTLGTLDPLRSAQLASSEGVRVYTIGIGSLAGGALTHTSLLGEQRIQVPGVDEETLQSIAKITDANYRRATDATSFQAIFDEIGALEKSDLAIDAGTISTPIRKLFAWFLLFLLGLLVIDRSIVKRG